MSHPVTIKSMEVSIIDKVPYSATPLSAPVYTLPLQSPLLLCQCWCVSLVAFYASSLPLRPVMDQ